MTHRRSEQDVFLEQGGLYCTRRPSLIRTVLGSCVAVCLLDRRGRAGGMNHYVLPECPDAMPDPRYGDVAIARLILGMNRIGCPNDALQAKIFGGAAVLPYGEAEDTVGSRNIALAEITLRDLGIPITARRTGGQAGMIVHLHTVTGEVLVRSVTRHANAAE
jgi:chemotaxis protein CheD